MRRLRRHPKSPATAAAESVAAHEPRDAGAGRRRAASSLNSGVRRFFAVGCRPIPTSSAVEFEVSTKPGQLQGTPYPPRSVESVPIRYTAVEKEAATGSVAPSASGESSYALNRPRRRARRSIACSCTGASTGSGAGDGSPVVTRCIFSRTPRSTNRES